MTKKKSMFEEKKRSDFERFVIFFHRKLIKLFLQADQNVCTHF